MHRSLGNLSPWPKDMGMGQLRTEFANAEQRTHSWRGFALGSLPRLTRDKDSSLLSAGRLLIHLDNGSQAIRHKVIEWEGS